MAKSFTGLCESIAPIAGLSAATLRVRTASASKAGCRVIGDADANLKALALLLPPMLLAGNSERAGTFIKAMLSLRRTGGDLLPGKSNAHSFFASFVGSAPKDIIAAQAQILLFNYPVQLVFKWGSPGAPGVPPKYETAIFQTSSPAENRGLRDIKVIEPELLAAISEYLHAPEKERRMERGRFSELERIAEAL